MQPGLLPKAAPRWGICPWQAWQLASMGAGCGAPGAWHCQQVLLPLVCLPAWHWVHLVLGTEESGWQVVHSANEGGSAWWQVSHAVMPSWTKAGLA